MTTQQTEALRLAELLETNIWEGVCGESERKAAATELRRLYALNQELLDALKAIVEYSHDWETQPDDLRDIARAAITKAQEQA